MDETAVPVRGGKYYLYRAVDRHGKSVESLLSENRDIIAAQAFFRGAVDSPWRGRWPHKSNVDGGKATHRALRLLGKEDSRWNAVIVRTRRYLNNIVEEDDRAIKRRCAAMLGLKSFRTAAVTLAGIELAHRIRKQQFHLRSAQRCQTPSLKHLWECALA
jgi:transposase-like protein